MKKISFFVLCVMLAATVTAQTDKYTTAMKTNIDRLDTTMSEATLNELANNFERIGDAEKTKWLPYYYATLAELRIALLGGMQGGQDGDKIDQVADKAEKTLVKAEALEKENAEIYILKKMLATARLMVDPASRWQTYGPEGAAALAKAKQLDADNPRVTLQEAEDKYFTPEQFGGSKEEAKVLFEQSVNQFKAFKPATELHPQWGLKHAEYFLGQLNK